MRISIIVAVAENGVIGRGGQLPWRLPADLRRFKRLTMGHTVVMGRRTWESIGRQLPGRRMVVVSRQPGYRTNVEGVAIASGLDEAVRLAADAGEDEVFIIGGAELYREAIPRADRLYFTCVMADVEGDTFFPDLDWSEWCLLESEECEANESNEFLHLFHVLQRCEPKGRQI